MTSWEWARDKTTLTGVHPGPTPTTFLHAQVWTTRRAWAAHVTLRTDSNTGQTAIGNADGFATFTDAMRWVQTTTKQWLGGYPGS
jgi:hypothetical protein